MSKLSKTKIFNTNWAVGSMTDPNLVDLFAHHRSYFQHSTLINFTLGRVYSNVSVIVTSMTLVLEYQVWVYTIRLIFVLNQLQPVCCKEQQKRLLSSYWFAEEGTSESSEPYDIDPG